MKYSFSAQFLKVLPPQTSFGDAWEAFCLTLLQREHGHQSCLPLKAPDRGVDILLRSDKTAIQCKADERGASGTISPTKSIESLRTAVNHKGNIGWSKYAFASNANYSGNGIEKIFTAAKESTLNDDDIEFLGPEYWSDLCDTHLEAVKSMLDYRLLYSEAEVEEAFRKARYYEEYVSKYANLIKEDCIRLEVTNNRTPLVLSIPFSNELTVKHCLDVSKSLLGLDLESETYADLGTSARPSLSLTLNKKSQSFSKKISEFSEDDLKRLQLWIKIVYEFTDDSDGGGDKILYQKLERFESPVSKSAAREQTLKRFESSIQNKMWGAIAT